MQISDRRLAIADRYRRQIANLHSSICNLKSFVPPKTARNSQLSRHAALAQVAFDPVAVGEGGREPGGDLRHGAKMARLCGFGEVSRGTCSYAPPGVYTQPRESPMTSRYQPRRCTTARNVAAGSVLWMAGSKLPFGPNSAQRYWWKNYLLRCGAERARRHGLSNAPRLEGGKHVSRLRTPRSRWQIAEVVQIDSRLPHRPDFQPRLLLTERSSSVDDLCERAAGGVPRQLL